VVFLALLVAAVSAKDVLSTLAKTLNNDPHWPEFVSFALKYERKYPSTAEASHRFNIFKQNEARNVQLRKQNPLAQFVVNKFADVSQDEFRRQFLGLNLTMKPKNIPKYWPHKHMIPPVKRDVHGVPNDIDWCADKGACTAIKNQGSCGSCWAFSATETLESAMAIAGAGLPTLSPEDIVDCDSNDGGCGGGDPRSALNFVASSGGLDTEASYPYSAGGGQAGQCASSQGTVGGICSGPTDVTDGDVNILQSFLQSTGPPSVCVDASSWSSYGGGVMTSCGCSIDHAVQATGLTSQFGTPAYIVRNSWGTDWGVGGFIYLAAGDQNTCCVANEVSWVSGAAPMA